MFHWPYFFGTLYNEENGAYFTANAICSKITFKGALSNWLSILLNNASFTFLSQPFSSSRILPLPPHLPHPPLLPPHPRQQGAEEEVLHDGSLLEHLAAVHLEHAPAHLLPPRDAADVVEHRRVLRHGSALHLLHERHARQVVVVARKVLQDVVGVDGPGPQVRVPHQLRGAEHEGHEVEVVQTPHAVRARGLQAVGHLQAAHEGEVPAGGGEGEREEEEERAGRQRSALNSIHDASGKHGRQWKQK